MSIDHLKKQAKALRKLLPGFVQEHSTTPTLSACHELIARCSGYPSWHAAVTARSDAVEAQPDDPWEAEQRMLLQSFRSHLAWRQVRGDSMSEDALREGLVSVRIEPVNRAGAEQLEDQLNGFLESHDLRVESQPSATATSLRDLADLCQRQVSLAPWFIDAHAHLAFALNAMGRHEDAFKQGRPVFNALVAMLPDGEGFKGRISWYELSNRPFHRLAYQVASAYLANRAEGDGYRLRAEELVERLRAWWPNDNIGIRYLLQPRR